jgi:hypothetical protein
MAHLCKRSYEQNVAALRAQLPAADFDAAWEAGRALTLEQAVALAEQVTTTEQVAPTQTQAGVL